MQRVLGRRRALRLGGTALLGALAAVVLGPAGIALADQHPLEFFKRVKDPSAPTDLEKEHLITIRVPIIAEDGANVPTVVSMEHHPMEPDHHIRSIQVLNFNDPVVGKGLYHLTPANGQAYLSLQIRSDGGDAEVFAIFDCTQHGKWVASKTLKVSLGGC